LHDRERPTLLLCTRIAIVRRSRDPSNLRPRISPGKYADTALVLEFEWYRPGIKATIDKAGRLVIPKPLRDQLGLRPGEVEVTADGAGLRVEPLAGDVLEERGGRLVIPAGGAEIDDELVRSLRDAGQR
jgi:AbrB family looped-hinge helix DNA binding protein